MQRTGSRKSCMLIHLRKHRGSLLDGLQNLQVIGGEIQLVISSATPSCQWTPALVNERFCIFMVQSAGLELVLIAWSFVHPGTG